MATKFPAIPDPTSHFEIAVKECLEILLAIRGVRDSEGKFLDRAILYRELITLLSEDLSVINSVSTGLTSSVGFSPASEKTISGGAITMAGQSNFRFHTIDTEGDAASDDLNTINGGEAGELLLIKPESGDRTVVCKDGISLVLGRDFTMNNIADSMLLVGISQGVWYPLTKYNAG